MSTETIRVSGLVPATPKRIFEAWLDSKEHSRFTGGKATIEGTVGTRFTAWNGYIEGKNLVLEPGKRIVQSWRTKDFPEDAEDSRLEVVFEGRVAGETQISFLHSGIPAGQGHQYEEGWVSKYLTPMRRYFHHVAAAAAAAKAAKAASPAPAPATDPVAKSALRKKKQVKPKPEAKKRAAKAKAIRARKAKTAGRGRGRKPTAKRPGKAKQTRARARTRPQRPAGAKKRRR